MTKLLKEFFKGFIKDNPVLVLLLGLCPTLAVTTSAINGLSMGLATTSVLICSNIIISALRKAIPDNVRIPAFIVIIASFVTIIDLLMSAYFPEQHKTLGLFIPLIVVNCIILGRAEAFASKNTILSSLFDGAGMGLGFAGALTTIGAIREIIGNGTVFDFRLFSDSFQPALMMVLPPGGFFTLAFILFLLNLKRKK